MIVRTKKNKIRNKFFQKSVPFYVWKINRENYLFINTINEKIERKEDRFAYGLFLI